MKATLSIHQLYAKPILFVGLLLLLAGGASGADAEDLPVNGELGVCQAC